MKKKRYILGILFYVICILGLNLLLSFIVRHNKKDLEFIELKLNYKTQLQDTVQVFWGETEEFVEESSQTIFCSSGNLKFQIPTYISYLRIDLGTQPDKKEVTDIIISYRKWNEKFNLFQKQNFLYSNDIVHLEEIQNGAKLETIGQDPYCVFYLGYLTGLKRIQEKQINEKVLFICSCLDLIAVCLFIFRRKVKFIWKVFLKNRKMIWKLACNDFKTKYAGSYFGIFWAFVQPIITITLYWFVFEVGLKNSKVGETPFAIWLIAGLVPWFFHSDVVTNVTNCFIEYSYLVKKIRFPVGILPPVKMISAMFVHLFFLIILLLIYLGFGYEFKFSLFWLLYFSCCIGIYSLAISSITSILYVFFKDVGQIISIILQIFMWITPILWNLETLNIRYIWIFQLNPMYYIVNGYRQIMFGTPKLLSYRFLMTSFQFWAVCIVCLTIGYKLFYRLKPHFADVL